MRIISSFFILLFLLSACNGTDEPTSSARGVNVVRYAKHLRIQEEDNKATKIEILSPETGEVEQTLYVAREQLKKQNFVKTPLSKMAVLSSTHVGMLDKLQQIDKIVGIADKKYVFNRQLLGLIEQGKVLELGEEGQIPVESLLKSKCQAIIYSGFGKNFPHQKQLNAVGVDCIVNYDWRELHPLGKAEWILLFGYLTGKEREAKAYFSALEKRYISLKNQASLAKKKPSVLSGNLAGETWFAPAGGSFHAQMFNDAHVNYRYAASEGTGSLALTMERVLMENKKTDFWINTGIGTKEQLFGSQPKLRLLGPVSKNPLYDYAKSGNRYWELSAIEPDHVLADYIKIFHPGLLRGETLYFYAEVE